MLLDEVVLFNHSEISPEDFDVSRTVWRFAWGMCVLGRGGGVSCETSRPSAHPLSLSLSEGMLDPGFTFPLRIAHGYLPTSKY